MVIRTFGEFLVNENGSGRSGSEIGMLHFFASNKHEHSPFQSKSFLKICFTIRRERTHMFSSDLVIVVFNLRPTIVSVI